MTTDLKQFFMDLSIDGFFRKVPFLGATAKLSNKNLLDQQLDQIKSDSIYIDNITNEGDLILGEKFNVIFTKENPRDYIITDAEVDYLSLKKGDNIGIMPKGRGGIVRLKFKDSVPEITKLLMQSTDEQFDKEKHQFIYFTTQEVMDSILEELDKLENPLS